MDHFNPNNLDWQPLLLHAWRNSKGGVHALKRSGSIKSNDPYVRFLYDVLLMLLYRIVSTAGAPFGRVVAAYIWMGHSVKVLVTTLQKVVFAFIGWQSGRTKSPWLRFITNTYPNVRRWHVTVALLMGSSLAVKFLWRVWLFCNHVARRKHALQKNMIDAKTYTEWMAYGGDLDELQAKEKELLGKPCRSLSSLYAVELLQDAKSQFEKLRESGDVVGLMFALRSELYRDFGNMTNTAIHSTCHVLPKPIMDYITAVNSHLDYICDYTGDELTPQLKLNFFQETRHTFGQSALVLSGGGALGAFHLGVVRALLEQGVLPRIIAGSSVGSIVAAIIAVHTDEELKVMYTNMDNFNLSFFSNSTSFESIHHLLTKGTLQDISYLIERLRALLGDLTFVDVFERTGRMLNVTVTACDTNEPPRMLNYLTAPHCVVWSAVAASSAFPGLFPPQELLAKDKNGRFSHFAARSTGGLKRRWNDGSLENDLPFRKLSELFNVNHFIVSQTNPHIVPLMSIKSLFSRMLAQFVETEIKHFMLQAQLYMPTWFPTKWTRLFTQPWEGDVTILLPWKLYSKGIGKAIQNPSSAELVEADNVGRLSTWERMSAILGNCAIEMKLDQSMMKCLAQCAVARSGLEGDAAQHLLSNIIAAGRTARTNGSRLPSWLHLPSLPMFCGIPQEGPTPNGTAVTGTAVTALKSPPLSPTTPQRNRCLHHSASMPTSLSAEARNRRDAHATGPQSPLRQASQRQPMGTLSSIAASHDQKGLLPPSEKPSEILVESPRCSHIDESAATLAAVPPQPAVVIGDAELDANESPFAQPAPQVHSMPQLEGRVADRLPLMADSCNQKSVTAFDAVAVPLDHRNPAQACMYAGGSNASTSPDKKSASDWAGNDCTDTSVHLWNNLLPLAQVGDFHCWENNPEASSFSMDFVAP